MGRTGTADVDRLLREVSGRISSRLEAEVVNRASADASHVVVVLRERGATVDIELPVALLHGAQDDPSVRHALQVRIKGRRDRMLFRTPGNAARSRTVETMPLPGNGIRFDRGPMRGRR